MIELNLLPEELKKVKERTLELPDMPVMSIMLGLTVVLVSLHLILFLFVSNGKNLTVTLQKKWEQMQPQNAKTEEVARELSELENRGGAIRKIAKPKLKWTEIFSGVNRAIISNVWLSEMDVRYSQEIKEGQLGDVMPLSLDITGYALGYSEEATSSVAKFITSIKNEEGLSGYFQEIELQSMRNRNLAGEEVMLFKLGCSFKKGPEDQKAVVETKK